jgi:hypothetical protein
MWLLNAFTPPSITAGPDLSSTRKAVAATWPAWRVNAVERGSSGETLSRSADCPA